MRKSLLGLLGVSIGAIALMLVAISAFTIVDAVSDWTRSRRVHTLAAADSVAYEKMQSIRAQRKDARESLLTDAAPAAKLEEFQRRMEADTQATAEAIRSAGLADGARIVQSLEQRWAVVAPAFRTAIAEGNKPKDQRDPKAIGPWFKEVGVLIDTVADASLAMANEARMASPAIAEMIMVRQAAWDARDYAGRACQAALMNVSEGKPFTPAQLQAFGASRGGTEVALGTLQKLLSRQGAPQPVRAALETALTGYRDNRAQQDKVLQALAGATAPVMAADAWNESCTAPTGGILKIGARALDEVKALAGAGFATAQTRLALASAFLLAALLLSGGVVWLLLRRFARPLSGLTLAVDRLSRGEDADPVPATGHSDELGRMGDALEQLRRQAVRAKQLEAEKISEMRQREQRQQALESGVSVFQSAVSSVLGSLHDASAHMNRAADVVTSAAEQTSAHAGDATVASGQTTANVQTVAAATEELSASIQEIARQMSTSTSISTQAVTEAGRIDELVGNLSEAASQIDTVVGLINSIAGQTNLLALNATIEAARAGEAGKGFAVVASEVKALASQTVRATEDIQAKVSEIQGATGSAAAAMRGIGATIRQLNEIATTVAAAIEEQGAATQEIASNVQQAARGTQAVSNSIETLHQAARQTDGAAGQVSDAAQRVSADTERLRGEVDRFLTTIHAA